MYARSAYYRRMTKLPEALGRGVYIGADYEWAKLKAYASSGADEGREAFGVAVRRRGHGARAAISGCGLFARGGRRPTTCCSANPIDARAELGRAWRQAASLRAAAIRANLAAAGDVFAHPLLRLLGIMRGEGCENEAMLDERLLESAFAEKRMVARALSPCAGPR